MRPTSFVAIDWSGAKRTPLKSLWSARVEDGELVELIRMRTRDEAVRYAIDCCKRRPATVVGLDFAFSVPKWYADHLGVSTCIELWSRVSKDGEQWLSLCQLPFWGIGKTRPHPHHEPFRQTERIVQRITGHRPKSVFQINYPGAVGKSSIRGMPYLRSIQLAGISIWPFDPPKLPLVLEIYPRLLSGAIVKSDKNERCDYLKQKGFRLAAKDQKAIEASDDAFDASVSAFAMAEHVDRFPLPEACTLAHIEGEIWRP